ncbi:MAG: DUF4149 domain-containing protein [Pikeienuella sp.]
MKPTGYVARLRPMAAAIWLGMLVGVSFIATPVKFQAADLDLPTALDVGRLTFGAFSRVEWFLAPCLIIATFAGASRWRLIVAAIVAAGLLTQAFWLLPALNARVAMIIAGENPGASFHHMAYGGVELLKFFGLLALSLPAWAPQGQAASAPADRDWRTKAA